MMRLSRFGIVVTCLLTVIALGGCSGVILSPTYSQLLDETTALSKETADRAEAGTITADTMKLALRKQATTWARFKDARDGKDGTEVK